MKQAIQKPFSVKLFFIMIFCVLGIWRIQIAHPTDTLSIEDKREIFKNTISTIAERYIGMPLRLGNNLEISGGLDNSHLFYQIYKMAARQAGLRSIGYMPMKELLKRTVAVQPNELKNGDLIVLNDSHAAMIYRVEKQDKFCMIYASEKRQQVISFNNQNVVFEVYWLENLKGYFRMTEDIFLLQN